MYSVSFSFSLVSGSILSPVELVICAQLTPLSNHRQECRSGGRGAGRCVELCICHCLCHCVKEFGVVVFFLPPLPCCCYFVAWPSFWDSCLVSDNEGILVYVKLRLQIAPYAPYSWLCVALYSLGLYSYPQACSSGCEHRSPTHQLIKPSVYEGQPTRRKLKRAELNRFCQTVDELSVRNLLELFSSARH